jgi:protein TonB
VTGLGTPPPAKPVEFEVIENPRRAPEGVLPVTVRRPAAPKPPEEEGRRAVFGISKKALTEDSVPGEPAVEVKTGNTLAVAPDERKLEPGDAESLPIPTEEYLVTEMPRLLAEVRIPYPEAARSKGIEGPVAIDLLIDAEGAVRDATLLSGPGGGLNEAALEAVRGVRFRPARIGEKAVPVRIRYVYRFVLER